jgi:hypothetical protein
MADLSNVCKTLNPSIDKFVVAGSSAVNPAIGAYDPTGLQTVELGYLDVIYANQSCHFCRLVFHATHGEDGPGIGLDGLSRDGKRIPCFMA